MGCVEIPLGDAKNRGLAAVIDRADADLVAGFNWRVYWLKASSTPYASAWHGEVMYFMHRLILGAPNHLEVDHINGNGLDNRRVNIRLATHQQNMGNRIADRRKKPKSCPYKGVYYKKERQYWIATIHTQGRTRYLGSHPTPEAAAAAYDIAATEIWGEFARLNLG